MAEEERSLSDNQDYHTGEHILVCITAAPSSAKVIRTAARLADAFRAGLQGWMVETAKIREADEKTKAALRENMEIAKVLGARVVTVCGSGCGLSDRPVCQDQQCIKNRFGEDQSSYHPAHVPVRAFGKAYLPGPQYRRIHHTGYAPDQTIPSVPDGKKEERGLEKNGSGSVTHYGCDGSGSVSVLSISEAGTFGIGSDHTILLGVLISSYIADRKIYSLYSALLSVVLYNFFCIEPLYSLKAYDRGDSVTFILLFFSGFFAAAMTRKLKQQNAESAKIAYRTGLLLENSQRAPSVPEGKRGLGADSGPRPENF